MNVKFRKITSYAWNFQILPVFSQFLWNLTFIFADSHNKFSLLIFQITNYIFKNPKENTSFFKFFWYKVFCPLKIKITRFPGRFRLNFLLQDFRFFGFLQIVRIWITPCMHVSFFVREYGFIFLLCQYGAGPSF